MHSIISSQLSLRSCRQSHATQGFPYFEKTRIMSELLRKVYLSNHFPLISLRCLGLNMSLGSQHVGDPLFEKHWSHGFRL